MRAGNLCFVEIHYYTAASLDGVLATGGNSLDWIFPLGDTSDPAS